MKKERPNNPNAIRYFGMGVGLIGIFIMFVIDPPPDYVTLQCERTKGICILEESGLFQFRTKYIKIKEIRHHQGQVLFLAVGTWFLVPPL